MLLNSYRVSDYKMECTIFNLNKQEIWNDSMSNKTLECLWKQNAIGQNVAYFSTIILRMSIYSVRIAENSARKPVFFYTLGRD